MNCNNIELYLLTFFFCMSAPFTLLAFHLYFSVSNIHDLQFKINSLTNELTEILTIGQSTVLSTDSNHHHPDPDPDNREPNRLFRMKDIIDEVLYRKLQILLPEYDKTGRPDFALEELGGEIYSIGSTKLCDGSYVRTINTPKYVLQPNIKPGNCFCFMGGSGMLIIRLMANVFIDSVTIEHIPKEMSITGKIDSATKLFRVSGIDDKFKKSVTFGEFNYDIERLNRVQTFLFPPNSTMTSYRFVEFQFLSNHGQKYTCVYRLRVHGRIDDK